MASRDDSPVLIERWVAVRAIYGVELCGPHTLQPATETDTVRALSHVVWRRRENTTIESFPRSGSYSKNFHGILKG